jgi:hypothetical protein
MQRRWRAAATVLTVLALAGVAGCGSRSGPSHTITFSVVSFDVGQGLPDLPGSIHYQYDFRASGSAVDKDVHLVNLPWKLTDTVQGDLNEILLDAAVAPQAADPGAVPTVECDISVDGKLVSMVRGHGQAACAARHDDIVKKLGGSG